MLEQTFWEVLTLLKEKQAPAATQIKNLVNAEFIQNWEKMPKEVQLALTAQVTIAKKAAHVGMTSLSDNILIIEKINMVVNFFSKNLKKKLSQTSRKATQTKKKQVQTKKLTMNNK